MAMKDPATIRAHLWPAMRGLDFSFPPFRPRIVRLLGTPNAGALDERSFNRDSGRNVNDISQTTLPKLGREFTLRLPKIRQIAWAQGQFHP